MRVGVVTSSKNIALSLKKNLMLIFALSLLYAVNVFAIGEIKLLPNTEGGGELRPFIFIPALAAILFGPLVGSFSAGIGNVLIDIIADVIIEGDTLDLGNLAGFFGNFIGAGIVGILAWRLKFKKDDSIFFSHRNWLNYFRNAIVSALGLGLICGEIIGLLRVAFRVSTWDVGNIISTSIFYYNSLFLLVSIIPLQLIVGIYEKIRARRYEKQVHDSKNVVILESPEDSLAIIENFQIISLSEVGGLVKGAWSQIKLTIRNNSTIPMVFRLEINCEDRIDPSVIYTKLLQPREADDKFLQINPFNDSERIFTVYIKPWSPTFSELTNVSTIGASVRYRYTYNVLTPFEHHFTSFTNFLAICAIALLALNAIRTIYGFDITNLEKSRYFIWALVVCGAEILVVFGWYFFRLITVRRRIARTIEKAQQQQLATQQRREEQQLTYESELQQLSGKFGLVERPEEATSSEEEEEEAGDREPIIDLSVDDEMDFEQGAVQDEGTSDSEFQDYPAEENDLLEEEEDDS